MLVNKKRLSLISPDLDAFTTVYTNNAKSVMLKDDSSDWAFLIDDIEKYKLQIISNTMEMSPNIPNSEPISKKILCGYAPL